MNESHSYEDSQKASFDASERLNPDIYRELRKLAARRMSGANGSATLQPTVLVHEAWLKLSDKPGDWKDEHHFLAAAAVTMRHILIDHVRKKARIRHGGGHVRTQMADLNALADGSQDEDLLLVDEGVNALAQVHPLRAKIVVARFFGGMNHKEIAGSLGIGERSVERHWAAAKVWLYRWMKQEGDL